MTATRPASFSYVEFKYVKDACHELGFEDRVPTTESLEVDCDAIVCSHGFTIQKLEVEVPTISKPNTFRPRYVVSETVWTPATRWQPEDADYRDFATVDSLADAVKAMLLRDYEYKIDNVLEGMAMAAAYGNPVEL